MIKAVKRHMAIIAICLFLLLIAKIGDISCPIQFFLNVPCPTCGTTRAMTALFRLDFDAYVSYQPFALPLVIAVLLGVHFHLFARKSRIYFYIAIVLVLNTVWYICRLIS